MVCIADPEWFAIERAHDDDLREVNQWNGQNQQRRKHGQRTWILSGIEMRQNRHNRQQITDKLAAGVAQKYSPFVAAINANKYDAIAPSPAQRPFILSMKLKAFITVSSHRMVMA